VFQLDALGSLQFPHCPLQHHAELSPDGGRVSTHQIKNRSDTTFDQLGRDAATHTPDFTNIGCCQNRLQF
jgi:hypothetical protein